MSQRSRVRNIHDPAYGLPVSGQCPGSQPDSKEEQIAQLKPLLTRAADALSIMTQFLLISDVPLEWEESRRKENMAIIAELRKAAQ